MLILPAVLLAAVGLAEEWTCEQCIVPFKKDGGCGYLERQEYEKIEKEFAHLKEKGCGGHCHEPALKACGLEMPAKMAKGPEGGRDDSTGASKPVDRWTCPQCVEVFERDGGCGMLAAKDFGKIKREFSHLGEKGCGSHCMDEALTACKLNPADFEERKPEAMPRPDRGPGRDQGNPQPPRDSKPRGPPRQFRGPPRREPKQGRKPLQQTVRGPRRGEPRQMPGRMESPKRRDPRENRRQPRMPRMSKHERRKKQGERPSPSRRQRPSPPPRRQRSAPRRTSRKPRTPRGRDSPRTPLGREGFSASEDSEESSDDAE